MHLVSLRRAGDGCLAIAAGGWKTAAVTDVIGREQERERIRRLLDTARGGRGGALLVCGPAGIGKTTLLDDAVTASGLRALRVTGVPGERDLAWAGLHDLLRPLVARVDELPEPQQTALVAALALRAGPPPDRLGVAAGTLSLLGSAAAETPLVVVVDDAQWLDAPSAEAIAFAARRLRDDPVAVLVAVRSDERSPFPAHGLDTLELGALPAPAGAALVRAIAPAVRAAIAQRVAATAAGHPLGIVETARSLTPAQAAGAEALPDPLPAGTGVEALYRPRVESLPAPARTAALALALAPDGDMGALHAALSTLAVRITDLQPAEDCGLVTLQGDRPAFRHPLARAAVHAIAGAGERRRAHAALADALRAGSDAALWHRAAAALEPDEDLARALAARGERALEESVQVAERALARAADLSPDPADRADRLLAAALAAWDAGAADRAAARVEAALPALRDPGRRADALRLHARIELKRGSAGRAAAALAGVAEDVARHDPARAARMLAEAVEPWLLAGHPERAYDAARAARAVAADADGPLRVEVDLRVADALGWQGRIREADRLWRQIVAAVDADPALRADPWTLYRAGEAAFSSGDPAGGAVRLRAAIDAARAAGLTAAIPYMAVTLVWSLCLLGELDEAAATATEAVALAGALGQTSDEAFALAALAWVDAHRGDEAACRAHAADAEQLAGALDLSGLEAAHPALGLLELGRGNHAAAVDHLEAAVAEHERRGSGDVAAPRSLVPMLVEALVRSGHSADARALLEPFARQAAESGRAAARPAVARCRALLAADADATALFGDAATGYEQAGYRLDAAHTRLCLGERLRRMRRRADARLQLRAAEAAFTAAGAAAWAARAREELAATGERRRPDDPAERDRLTPQEQQIARLVASGLTNRQVGARLFLSEKTIETHLGRTFRKLDVRSRTALAATLAASHERDIPDSTPPLSA